MIGFVNGTRMIQTLKGKKNDEYYLFNKYLDGKIIINEKAAFLVRKLYKRIKTGKDTSKFVKRNKELFDYLLENSILKNQKTDDISTVFIQDRTPKFPLSCFNIEITEGCNLNCIHCYGNFGNNKLRFIEKEKVFNILDDLNILNTHSIGITGGESTIHPDFIEICSFFLNRGFELTVFTNGLNYKKTIELLKMFPYKKITIKVSLDGFELEHNRIRGNSLSYINCIKLLDTLKKYKNCSVFVSSVIMRENVDRIQEFSDFIKKEYPDYIYSVDLITPSNENKHHCFDINDFDVVNKKYPPLFKTKDNDKESNLRCSGGVSQCTLTTRGELKICNGAIDDIFKFKYNVFTVGLLKAWKDCGDNIKNYRSEKKKALRLCKKCAFRKMCFSTDCRIISKAYTGTTDLPNPLVCYSMRKKA